MARKPRIHFRGAVYHVLLHGLDNQTVFRTAADRRQWLELIEDGLDRFGHKVHAYCLGRNFIQLAIEVDHTPLSKIMQNLSFRYTRYFNARNERQGALFHGRYKAVLIDAEHYLNDLVRFIHNTPVRMGQASDAASSKWTSHSAYLGADNPTPWLTTETVLKSYSSNVKRARTAFARFVKAGVDEGDRSDLVRGVEGRRILGDARFVRKVLRPARTTAPPISLQQLVKRVCREEGVKEAQLAAESRARRESQVRQTITYLATEMNLGTLTALSNRFNRDLTTMSRNQRYFRERLAEDQELQKHVKKLKRRVLKG